MTRSDDRGGPEPGGAQFTEQDVRALLQAAAVLTALAESMCQDADDASPVRGYAEEVSGYAEALRALAGRHAVGNDPFAPTPGRTDHMAVLHLWHTRQDRAAGEHG